MIPPDAPLGLPHEAMRGWAVAVLAVCAAACLVIAFAPAARRAQRRRPRVLQAVPPWLLVVAAALLLRGAASLVQDGAVFDVLVSYRSIGDRFLHGSDIWSGSTESLATYPPPVYAWWGFSALVPAGDPHLFAALVRAPFWVADALLAGIVARLLPPSTGPRAGWIYALCPVAIAVPTLHGQHDPVTDLLLVVAVAVLLPRGRVAAAGLTIGLATALKQWPVFFLLPLLATLPRRRIAPFLLAVAAPPVLAFVAYGLVHPTDAVRGAVDVATYRPHREGLGTSLLMPDGANGGVFVLTNLVVTVGAGAVAALLVRRGWGLADAMAVDMLLLVGLSPTVSDQYLMWAFPFLLLAGRLRTSAVLGAGLLPAVVALDLWQTVNDGDAPHALLLLASVACVASAVWIVADGVRVAGTRQPTGDAPEGRPQGAVGRSCSSNLPPRVM